jgi:hypothetical protein
LSSPRKNGVSEKLRVTVFRSRCLRYQNMLANDCDLAGLVFHVEIRVGACGCPVMNFPEYSKL